jgi:3-dehydroquinate dehydratase-2
MSGRGNPIVVLNGVNLNLLGERPAVHYGTITLAELERLVCEEATRLGWRCLCRQTNHEGQFVDLIQEFRHSGGLIVNPGAWTHYSYAIRDALEAVTCPIAEVHLSDISAREDWRRVSVITEVATFTISGRGAAGYVEAVQRLVSLRGD